MALNDRARPQVFDLKPYVPGKPISEVKRELGIDEVIKLASNENPLGPSPKGKEAAHRAVDDLMLYPDGNCYELKQTLASYFKVSEKQLLIGNGSDEILKLLAETFLNVGDNIVCATPSFSEYEFVAGVMGAEIRMVPVNNFRLDLPAMLAQVDAKTKMFFVCNPNNPTGTILYKDELDELMAKIPASVLVIFDEAYYEYVEDERNQTGLSYLAAGYPNVVVLRTFSKIYGLAGLRVGYGISTEEVVDLVMRVREPFNVNLMAQEAAVAAIGDDDHVKRSCANNSQGKSYLYREFDKLGFTYAPTEANFILVDVGRNCQEVFTGLLKQGVIVRTGNIFGADFVNYIRVTIGTPEQNERFIKALKAVLEV
ncbi:MAG: histidinol-phosphate transaminase [Methylocystaceae bacterium]